MTPPSLEDDVGASRFLLFWMGAEMLASENAEYKIIHGDHEIKYIEDEGEEEIT